METTVSGVNLGDEGAAFVSTGVVIVSKQFRQKKLKICPLINYFWRQLACGEGRVVLVSIRSSQSNPDKTKPKSCPCSLIAFGGNLLLWVASPQGLCGVSMAVGSDRPKAIKRKRTQKFVQEPILMGGNLQVERPLHFFPQFFLISKN